MPKITKELLEKIRTELDIALEAVAKSTGVEISLSADQFDPHSTTFSLNIVSTNKSTDTKPNWKETKVYFEKPKS